jgi:antitoxin HicB
MVTAYPALFLKNKDEDGYTVIFPDLEGCVTCGDTAEEAIAMAQDALGLYLDQPSLLPPPSSLRPASAADNADGDFDIPSSFSSYVYVDMAKQSQEDNA